MWVFLQTFALTFHTDQLTMLRLTEHDAVLSVHEGIGDGAFCTTKDNIWEEVAKLRAPHLIQPCSGDAMTG